jgi:hypothetical protein
MQELESRWTTSKCRPRSGSCKATVVMAHLEKKQSEHLVELQEFRHRTEQNLAEITDKLNGLIGYVAGQRPNGGFKQ